MYIIWSTLGKKVSKQRDSKLSTKNTWYVHLQNWKSKKHFMQNIKQNFQIKFIYSEKATKFCEIPTLLLSYVVPVKSKVEILRKAFSEYMNFNTMWKSLTNISRRKSLICGKFKIRIAKYCQCGKINTFFYTWYTICKRQEGWTLAMFFGA